MFALPAKVYLSLEPRDCAVSRERYTRAYIHIHEGTRASGLDFQAKERARNAFVQF